MAFHVYPMAFFAIEYRLSTNTTCHKPVQKKRLENRQKNLGEAPLVGTPSNAKVTCLPNDLTKRHDSNAKKRIVWVNLQYSISQNGI